VGVEVLAGAGVDVPAAVGDEAVVVEAGLEPAVAACVAAGRFRVRAGDAERWAEAMVPAGETAGLAGEITGATAVAAGAAERGADAVERAEVRGVLVLLIRTTAASATTMHAAGTTRSSLRRLRKSRRRAIGGFAPGARSLGADALGARAVAA
jgi:hypothetical protein